MGNLKVYSEIQNNQIIKPINELWSLTTELGDTWHIARVPTDYRSNFRIIFEGSIGESPDGDIVIYLEFIYIIL